MLNRFLRDYRATPHSTTGQSPAQLMFQRPIKFRLPEKQERERDDEVLRRKDEAAKAKQKQYANLRNHAKQSSLRVGDPVLIRVPQTKKSQPPFNPEPYTLTAKKGSMCTATNSHGHRVVRNSSFMKRLHEPPHSATPTSVDDRPAGSSQSPSATADHPPSPQRGQHVVPSYNLRPRTNKTPSYLRDFVAK